MPDRDLALSLGTGGMPPSAALDLARRVGAWGYTAAWASEVDGPDAVSLLGAAAASTDLALGVAVLPVQTRTAFVLGMTALSLAELTGGRFSLGVGASSEVLVSRFAGQPFDRPLTHVREMVRALRPLLAGERTDFHGDYVDVGGYRCPVAAPTPVPLLMGSLNRRSLRAAGELADGVCFNQMAPHHVPRMLDEVRAGARDAGRTLPDDFPVVARLFCHVTDDVAAARRMVRHVFAPYVATSVYNRFYRWMGYEDEAAAIARAAAARDRDAMAAAFSDRVVDDLFVIGSADEVAARLHAYVDAGVTVPVIDPMTSAPQVGAATLEAVGRTWSG